MTTFDQFVQRLAENPPEWAVVLGSGLGEAPRGFISQIELPFSEIPNFAEPSVQGHGGRLCYGLLNRKPLLVSRGRIHFYEGHSWEKILRLVELFSQWRIPKLLLTNAAGGLNPLDNVGDLVLLKGHVFLQSIGSWNSEFRAWQGYSNDLSQKVIDSQRLRGREVRQGLYAALTGPSYETPAEIRALAKMNVDLVGMSTAKEAERFAQLGGEVIALSCVTNKAAGLGEGPLDHAHITEAAKLPVQVLSEIIADLL